MEPPHGMRCFRAGGCLRAGTGCGKDSRCHICSPRERPDGTESRAVDPPGALEGSAGPAPLQELLLLPISPDTHTGRRSQTPAGDRSTRSQSWARRTYLGSSPGAAPKGLLEAPTVPARTLNTTCHTCHRPQLWGGSVPHFPPD